MGLLLLERGLSTDLTVVYFLFLFCIFNLFKENLDGRLYRVVYRRVLLPTLLLIYVLS
jgi:hypothetical protein